MLAAGDIAPAFALPDADLNMIDLADFRGSKVVLYFYPKDDTPGCTIEALEFTEMMDEFVKQDTVVLGISKDNCQSHGAFRDKHGLTVQLLADSDGEVCDKYGVWQEREKEGHKLMAIVRSTFVIDREGLIRQALYDIKPKGHALAVLDLVRGLP